MRNRSTVVLALACALACASAGAARGDAGPLPLLAAAEAPGDPAPPDQPTELAPVLRLEPEEAVSDAGITATGNCPKGPSSITIEPWGDSDVEVAVDGDFGPTSLYVPRETPPGPYTVTASCDGAPASASFTVLEAPTLELDPPSGPPGTVVTAKGTCRSSSVELLSAAPALFWDDVEVTTGQLDDRTGRFVATLTVPDDVGLGPHEVRPDCGDVSSFFTVLPAPPDAGEPDAGEPDAGEPDPGEPGPGEPDPGDPGQDPGQDPGRDPPGGTALVLVPDLTGLTEQEAAGALGTQLHLANPTGAEGLVVQQDPAAGAEVPAGSAVSVLLETVADPVVVDPQAAANPRPLLLAALLVALVVGAVTGAVAHEHRARRERRWLDDHVAVEPSEPGPPRYPEPPDEPLPGFDVRLDVRPRKPTLQEVGRADG